MRCGGDTFRQSEDEGDKSDNSEQRAQGKGYQSENVTNDEPKDSHRKLTDEEIKKAIMERDDLFDNVMEMKRAESKRRAEQLEMQSKARREIAAKKPKNTGMDTVIS